MRITVEVREQVLSTRKTAKQIEDDIREGVTMLWLARGEIEPANAQQATGVVAAEGTAPTPAAAPPKGSAAGFKEFLRSMPDVGDDADFERPLDYGRSEAEWDT